MKRTVVAIGVALALGIAGGVIGTQVLNAPPPLNRPELMRPDLEGIGGKQAVVALGEVASGAVAGKHYHPGHEVA